MARKRKPKITPLSDSERKCFSQARRLLEVAGKCFPEGKHPKLRHVQMLIEQGLREDGVPIMDEFLIEHWETMEVRPFSNPTREGYGMIFDTVNNLRLTPRGREAYEMLAAAAQEVFE